MTTKILSGTYTAGYTLSAGYSVLSITGSGLVEGPLWRLWSRGGWRGRWGRVA